MAFTRKFLKALGLTEEQVDSVVEAHTETVDGLKSQMEGYKADAEKLEGVQRELDDLKAKGGGEDYKSKYDSEHAAFEKYKNDQNAKESAALAERLYREQLNALGITGKRADGIVRLTDLSTVKIKDGKLEDADGVKKGIQTDYADFIPKKRTDGADPADPPHSGGKMSREEIYKKDDKGRYLLSTAERQKALAESMAAESE